MASLSKTIQSTIIAFYIFSGTQAQGISLYDQLTQDYDPTINTQVGPVLSTSKSCDIREITISGMNGVEQKKREVYLLEYSPTNNSKAPTMLLLPPTGGVNALDKGYARSFCNGLGARVVILLGWENAGTNDLDPATHDREARRSLSAMRHTLEYIGENNVPLLGTSVGALSATLLMGIDDRISSGVLIVGGIGMSTILATSTQQDLTKLRTARMLSQGFTSLSQYVSYMGKHVKIDPGLLSGRYQNKPVLLITATQDTVVPTHNQLALNSSFKNPTVIKIESSHSGAILKTYFTKTKKIRDFLRKNL